MNGNNCDLFEIIDNFHFDMMISPQAENVRQTKSTREKPTSDTAIKTTRNNLVGSGIPRAIRRTGPYTISALTQDDMMFQPSSASSQNTKTSSQHHQWNDTSSGGTSSSKRPVILLIIINTALQNIFFIFSKLNLNEILFDPITRTF